MIIIAEIGQNHNGRMEIAMNLIQEAKRMGATIAKFQLYDVDSVFSPSFKWYKEAKQAELSLGQTVELFEECRRTGIEFMASVFDIERVKWCEDLGMKRYKIASRSIHDKRLIDTIAATGKDMIVSLGMWRGKGFPRVKTTGKVDFLYCVSKYPAKLEDHDLLHVDFDKYSGFSDHTIGIEAALVAMARGARIIEKHFTLDKRMHGPDHLISMEPSELRDLVSFAERFERVLYH